MFFLSSAITVANSLKKKASWRRFLRQTLSRIKKSKKEKFFLQNGLTLVPCSTFGHSDDFFKHT
ncbi:hypothetical protein BpHYR1_044827 [Brachionus plicatilis]|uniref:Uncharacterized protein n=1 Tax=Brachionus plicatilis TaxID=10195 RepID=A0A3M7P8M6_BRAPC|nr:hypothetical protein BpHYR1_044827 [Brachionus plicatilis]